MEFNLAATTTESIIVRYFEKGLKPSIKAEIDQDATPLDNHEKQVAKVVRAEAKAGLQPSFSVRKTDLQVLQKSRPTHTIVHKVQTQEAMKNHYGNKPMAKGPASTCSQDFDFSNRSKKNKKKK